VLAEDEEKLCRHGGDVLVRVGEQGHQPVPRRDPLLRLILDILGSEGRKDGGAEVFPHGGVHSAQAPQHRQHGRHLLLYRNTSLPSFALMSS